MYRYRCEQCATTSPAVRSRLAVEYERDRHRQRFHGGHIPDGERLQRAVRSRASDRTALIALAVLAVLLIAWRLAA